MAITTKENTNVKSVIDMVTETYGNLTYLFDLLNSNPSLSGVNDTVEVGEIITYDDSVVFLTETVVNTDNDTPAPSIVKAVIVRDKQTLFDIAIQLYGDVTGVFDILEDNPSIDNINNTAITGINLVYTEQSLSLTEFFKTNNIFITTGFRSNRSFDDSFDLSFN